MRRLILGVAVTAAIAVSYRLGQYKSNPQAINSKVGRHVIYYKCPMHPAYRSEKPGVSDCGMQLEPVFAEDAADALPPSPELPAGAVRIDGSTQRLLGVRLAAVERAAGSRMLRVVGRVVPDDTRVYRINSGLDGFIRETFNDSAGVLVKKNQKLATYYSPDILAQASGFLAANARVPGSGGSDGSRTVPFPGALSKQGTGSVGGYTDRLRNLGMSDAQIKRMADSGQLPESIDIVAPADGFILARNISPGLHFMHDTEFYRIADLSRVWVVAEVYEQETPYLRAGGAAQITLKGHARPVSARIADSLPQSEAGGGTVKLRLEVDNSTFILRPEMLVDVELPLRLPSALTVPVDALVDSGAHTRVYVGRGEDVFEPREVKTGSRVGERVEILEGVQAGERVVVAATFLVDSESRLKTPSSGSAPSRSMDRPGGVAANIASERAMAGHVAGTKPASGLVPVDSITAAR